MAAVYEDEEGTTNTHFACLDVVRNSYRVTILIVGTTETSSTWRVIQVPLKGKLGDILDPFPAAIPRCCFPKD